MFDTKKARFGFTRLSHNAKMVKVKEILSILKGKSDLFADLYTHFSRKSDIADNVLEYLYNVIMNLIENTEDKESIGNAKTILQKLKSSVK